MHTRLLHVVIALLLCGMIAPASAQGKKPPQQFDPETAPWPTKIAFRVWQVRESIPVVDRVVLVPDEATYIDEISKWSISGQWPVLFEDSVYAPMFIRRFDPKEVIRRGTVERGPIVRDLEAHFRNIVAKVWSADGQEKPLADAFRARRHTPIGIVITATDDPAWTAALALAAGRGQWLAFVDEHFRNPNLAIPLPEAQRLDSLIEEAIAQTGASFNQLGDDIEAITICRDVAGRVEQTAGATGNNRAFLAITDVLGRNDDGSRYAFAGWIFGDEVRSAYIAMSSLFLPRTNMRLVNTYPNRDVWTTYGMGGAMTILGETGFDAHLHDTSEMSMINWLNQLPGGWNDDVVIMNSRGGADYFALASERAYPPDVPTLNHPAVVHFTHSWSFRSPKHDGTVGAQWLNRGAYAYVGAVHEPYLQAFVPPDQLAHRMRGRIPLLIAARHWDAPQWRVQTFGDPLMICLPPRKRIERPADEGDDLREQLRNAMTDAKDDASGEQFARAIKFAALLGEDRIAIELFRLAQSREIAAPSAPAALGPVFRSRDSTLFLEAWRTANAAQPAVHHTNMLWHGVLPDLDTVRNRNDVLLTLQSNLRHPLTHADLSKLVPYLERAFDPAYVHRAIQRAIEATDAPADERALRKLLEDVSRVGKNESERSGANQQRRPNRVNPNRQRYQPERERGGGSTP